MSCPEGSTFEEEYRGWTICKVPPHPPVQPMPLYFGVKEGEEPTPRLPSIGPVKAIIDDIEGPEPEPKKRVIQGPFKLWPFPIINLILGYIEAV